MNKPASPSDHTDLLNAILGDQSWDAVSSSIRNETLQVFQRRRKERKVRIAMLQAFCLLGVLSSVVYWSVISARQTKTANLPQHETQTAAIGDGGNADLKNHLISEAQMLAMFPPGSCLLAEVNGQKELVFLEPEKLATQ
jgi:hypothetical protein